jgi:aspartyl protease family protein
MSTWLALFILALGAILLVSDASGTVATLDRTSFAYLVAGLAMVVFIGGGLVYRYGGSAGAMLRDLVIWLAVGLGLVTLYSYRDALAPIADRVMGELVPGEAIVVSQGAGGHAEVKLRRRLGGHFTALAEIDGKKIAMIVDTGATTVLLRAADAAAIGVDTEHLRYDTPVDTANGTTMAARIRLDSVAIGPLVRTDIPALVARQGTLSESLLGMSFLSRLRSYEFSGGFLTLRG